MPAHTGPGWAGQTLRRQRTMGLAGSNAEPGQAWPRTDPWRRALGLTRIRTDDLLPKSSQSHGNGAVSTRPDRPPIEFTE